MLTPQTGCAGLLVSATIEVGGELDTQSSYRVTSLTLGGAASNQQQVLLLRTRLLPHWSHLPQENFLGLPLAISFYTAPCMSVFPGHCLLSQEPP